MKLKVLGAYGAEIYGFRSSAFLIDDRYLIDGGNIEYLKREEIEKIEVLFLSHAHFDHIKAIPFIAEVLAEAGKTLLIAGPDKVLNPLRSHIFNGIIWPDLTKIPSPQRPAIRFMKWKEGIPDKIDKYMVEFIPVNHTIPSYAIIINDGISSLMYTGDTGPTESIWREIQVCKNLKAVMIEVSYPDRMAREAFLKGHLTPSLVLKELQKASLPDVKILAYHLKPPYVDEIEKELYNLKMNISILKDGDIWEL